MPEMTGEAAVAPGGSTNKAESQAIARLAAVSDQPTRQRAVTGLHCVEIIYLHLLVAALAVGWLGLVLAEFGLFSLGALVITALPVAAGAFVGLRRAWRPSPVIWSWDVVPLAPLLLVAVMLFIPPFEQVIGGADPGVYVNTGANIARTGAILITDPDLASLSAEVRAGLFAFGQRLPGFYIDNYELGTVVPHGFHLYPTMLAVAHLLGGIRASLWVTPLVALLAVAGFYLLVRRLFGGTVAAVAAAFLVLNPGSTWFARFPAAEVLVQFWLFGGLLAFVLMLDTSSRGLAVVAGLALGAVHLTKIEAIALPLALGGFFAYQWVLRRWRVAYTYFLVAYGLVLLHAALHALFVSKAYFWYHFTTVFLQPLGFKDFTMLYTSTRGRLGLALLGGLLVTVTLGLVRWRNRIARILEMPLWVRTVPLVGAALVLLLATYAYYLRPPMAGRLPSLQNLSIGEIAAVLSQSSLTILSWYVSPIGLLLGILGYAIVLARRVSARNAVLLSLAFLETTLFLSDARVTPLHFWAARRYVPVIFPAFALFSAYFLWRLQTSLRGRWPEAIFAGVLGFVMGASMIGGWQPFYGHVEFNGALEQIGSLARQIPEGSVVLFEDTHAGQTLPTPLQYLWGRPCIVTSGEANDNGTTQRLMEELTARGREVYWVHAKQQLLPQGLGNYLDLSGVMPDVGRWGYGTMLVAEQTVDVPLHVAAIDHLPDTVDRLRYQLQVYKIVARR